MTATLPDGTVYRIDAGRVLFGAEPPQPAGTGPFAVHIPYTRIDSRTVHAAPSFAEWTSVAGSPIAYYAALTEWWASGETFTVIEHDVQCRPDVITGFEECPEPWCVFGYADMCHPECMEAWRNLLGCTRFRSELIKAVPDALTSIPADGWDWHNVCDGLGDNLRRGGYTHHWHFPPVDHHHFRPEETTHVQTQ